MTEQFHNEDRSLDIAVSKFRVWDGERGVSSASLLASKQVALLRVTASSVVGYRAAGQ